MSVFCAMTIQWESAPNSIRVATYSTVIADADGMLPSEIYFTACSKAAAAHRAPLKKMAVLMYYAAVETPVT
jgi:hypothetical protein